MAYYVMEFSNSQENVMLPKDNKKFAMGAAAMITFVAFVVYNYGFNSESDQKLTYGVLIPK